MNVMVDSLPMADRLSLGAQVLVIGMATVFAVLIILWLVLLLFRLFAYDLPMKKKQKATSAVEKTELPDNAPVAFEIKSDDNDDSQLIAVITAAIEAYNSHSGSSLPFRVVSFKRVKGAGGWSGKENNETV